MPSTSQKQHNLMAGVAKSPSFAKKVGIDRSVGEEYLKADRKNAAFMAGSGGGKQAAINKQNTNHGKMDMPYASLNKLAGKASGGQIVKGSARTKKFADGGDIRDKRDPNWDRLEATAYGNAKDDQAARVTYEPILGAKTIGTAVAKGKKKDVEAANAEAQKFNTAKRIQMAKGGKVMKSESKSMMKKEVDFFKKKGAPKSMVKHEEKEMKSKFPKFAKGGGIEQRGKTRGKMC